jgi:hypothetical protein
MIRGHHRDARPNAPPASAAHRRARHLDRPKASEVSLEAGDPAQSRVVRAAALSLASLTALLACAWLAAGCTTPVGCRRCESGETCRAGRCVPDEDAPEIIDAPTGADGDVPTDAPLPFDAGVDVGVDTGGGLDGGGCALRAWLAPGAATAFGAPRSLDCSSAHAPPRDVPIQAVLDLDGSDEAYFLTATTFHVLRLETLAWVASGARDALFPEASGLTLRGALGQELFDGAREYVMLLALPAAIFYSMDGATRTAALEPLSGGRPNPIDLGDAALYPNWAPGSNTSTPTVLDRARIVTAFHDSTGAIAPSREGVTCMGAGASCSDELPGIGSHYSALLTSDEVFLIDGFSCFCFFARRSIASFGPFATSSAPARSEWKHAVWNGGLWVFATP